MSAKISRRLRKQRRDRRKALRQQDRQTSSAQPPRHSSADQRGTDTAEQPTATMQPVHTAAAGTGRAARLIAVLVGCCLIGAAGGSVAFHIAEAGTADPLRQPANYVVAPLVAERLVCPPTPGTPESLSDSGALEYAERDDSAGSSRSALLFASAWGVTPSAEWSTITDEGRGEQDHFQEETAPENEPSGGPLADRQPTLAELPDTERPAVLEVQPLEGVGVDDAPAAAAGFTYLADEGPQSGLIASSCAPPMPSRWFLGPETGSGAASLLTLTNPSGREATVTVTTYSAEGSTGNLGATTLLVPADSVRTVNMASLTEDSSATAVHVQASGAPVASHLQSSRASGSGGLGTDMLPGMSEARTEHHMLAASAGSEEQPQLWLYTPGSDDGTVELQVFGPDGQVPIDTPGVFAVEDGEVTVVDVEGLEPGTYDVVVRTEEPSFAAVRSTDDGQQSEEAQDLSWSAAAEPVQPGFGAILPPVAETELRLFGQGQITYRLLDSSGAASEDITVDVEADRSTVVSHQQLQDHAEEAELDDAHSVVVSEVEGQTRGGLITRDQEGRFSVGALEAISPTAQYVPLRLQR